MLKKTEKLKIRFYGKNNMFLNQSMFVGAKSVPDFKKLVEESRDIEYCEITTQDNSLYRVCSQTVKRIQAPVN